VTIVAGGSPIASILLIEKSEIEILSRLAGGSPSGADSPFFRRLAAAGY
jgi:hypothetical protein